jgi:hypothetical protein
VAAGGAAPGLVALAVASRSQLSTWADRKIIFEHAIAVTTDNWLAHGNLGNTLLNEGDTDGAIAHPLVPLSSRTSASTVGRPRESHTRRAWMLVIVVSGIKSPKSQGG